MKAVRLGSVQRRLIGCVGYGEDLLDGLTRACVGESVKLGRISAIGAVQRAVLAAYDQARRVYEHITFNEPMEITNLTGNVSLRDGHPFVHAHVTLSRADGQAVGGHLAPGTIVFASEFVIEVFEGRLERQHDPQTGLDLWRLADGVVGG